MSIPVKSQLDLYNLFITTLQSTAPELTDTLTGSDIDKLGGVFSLAATELTRLIIDQFNKTFFDLANGPEITGGPDDLQTLAVDHFGNNFARPQAVAAIDTATFSRASAAAGSILISAGTVVKTAPDANGNSQRYTTNSDITLAASGGTSLSQSVGITAVVAGADGDAVAGSINIIETTLLDATITVTNAGNQTGADAQDDATYRETIRNLIEALAGATAQAIMAKALTVTGVVTATAVEQAINVIQYDIASGQTIGTWFRLAVPYLYVADGTGTASPTLITAVQAAIDTVRAFGVLINVAAAVSITLDWNASYTLNPSGPNHTVLLADPTLILNSMRDYINGIAIGTNFVRTTANAAILAIWGPAGTNDLTAFTTNTPSGDVAATATQKFVAGAMSKT